MTGNSEATYEDVKELIEGFGEDIRDHVEERIDKFSERKDKTPWWKWRKRKDDSNNRPDQATD